MDSARLGNNDGVLRATHALTQAVGAYARLFEVGELEARFNALMAEVEAMKHEHAPPVRGDGSVPAR